MSTTKLLLGVGLGVGAIAGFNYFRKLSLSNAYLEIVPSAALHKINLTGVYIRIDIRMKNPEAGAFKIQYPFMKIMYEGESIGSSQVIDKEIEIPANGEAVINGVMIEIPILNILGTGYKFYKALSANKAIKMQVLTHTTINLGWKTIPYDKVNDFTLKK